MKSQAALRPTGAFDELGSWVYTCTLGAAHEEALMHGNITVVPAGS